MKRVLLAMNIHVIRRDATGTYARVIQETALPDYGSVYPTSTHCLCWHCAHPFDSRPIPLPTSYDDRRKLFKIAGNFCSFACMTAYNKEYSRSHSGIGRGMAVYEMYKQMTGATSPTIPVAPPKQFLECFGGWMDIETFRAESEAHTYEFVPERCLPTTQVYKERCVTSSKSTRDKSIINKRFSETPGVRTQSETLKLRKTKSGGGDVERSAKKKATILEMTLGLC